MSNNRSIPEFMVNLSRIIFTNYCWDFNWIIFHLCFFFRKYNKKNQYYHTTFHHEFHRFLENSPIPTRFYHQSPSEVISVAPPPNEVNFYVSHVSGPSLDGVTLMKLFWKRKHGRKINTKRLMAVLVARIKTTYFRINDRRLARSLQIVKHWNKRTLFTRIVLFPSVGLTAGF